jgi:hypothetical protein
MFLSTPRRPLGVLALGLFTVLLPCLPARAQAEGTTSTEPDAASRKKAAEILDAIIDKTGGREARESIKATVSTATLDLVGMGITGKVTIYAADPHYSLSVAEIPGMGEMIEGCDGKVAWGTSLMTGPRLKEGTELAQALRASTFHADLHWRDLYKNWAYLGDEEVDGKMCHKLVVTPREGDPETTYVDVTTGLPHKRVAKAESPMGEMDVETLLSDYKEVDGILTPHKMTQKVMMQEITINVTSIENKKEADLSVFEPPAEIKELLEDMKTDGGAK